MNRATLLAFMAPLIAMSILLVALGVTAAWYVQNQQIQTSRRIGGEVHDLVLIHNLYMVARDVRYELNQYLRIGGPERLQKLHTMDSHATALLAEYKRTIDTPEKEQKLQQVEAGFRGFIQQLSAVEPLPLADRQAVLEEWADTKINEQILHPAEECLRLHEEAVVETAEANRKTTSQMTRGFLLMGFAVCGAGVLVGLTIARSLQRSLWELHVSVTGAAGKLERIEGPFPAPPHGGLIALNVGAKFLETRVAQVVEQLQEREQEVVRNEQLAAVGQLAAGLGHELRNPLMPIKMLVQAALARGDNVGLHGRQLVIIDQEICRMEASIQAFLDFAKPPALEKRRKDMRVAVQEAVELVQGLSRSENVTILCRLGEEPCELDFDVTQIKQVLLNLLLNALDAAGPAGRITVTVHANLRHDSQHGTTQTGNGQAGVWLIVADNGPGIPAEILANIFEPFVTQKEFGTGLGLTICRRIVEAHDGTIEARSAAGAPTEFRVWLPATPPQTLTTT